MSLQILETKKNKSMKIFILLVISFLIIQPQEDYTQKGTPLYVLTESSTLNLRDSANKGKVIAQLKKGEKVFLVKSPFTEPITSGWTIIKNSKGQEGYVSSEYISRFPVEEVEKISMISYLQESSAGANLVSIRPIIFKVGNKWVGNATEDHEPAYALKKLVSAKTTVEVFSSTGFSVDKLKLSSTSIAGCQNYLVGNIPFTENIQSLFQNETLFVLTNLKMKKEINKENSLTKEQISLVQKESESILKKNKIKDSEIQKFKLSENSFIKDGSRELISARFHLEEENKLETKYLYILFDSKSKKVLFQEFKQLSKDLIGYGGYHHLIGVLNVEGLDTIFIYKDYGFDGSIRRVMRLEKDKFIEVEIGGGDAC